MPITNLTQAANISILNNVTTISQVAEISNQASGGIFWGVMMVCFFFVLVFKLSARFGIDKAVAACGFICMILCLPLLRMELISIVFPILFALASAGALFYIRFNAESSIW